MKDPIEQESPPGFGILSINSMKLKGEETA